MVRNLEGVVSRTRGRELACPSVRAQTTYLLWGGHAPARTGDHETRPSSSMRPRVIPTEEEDTRWRLIMRAAPTSRRPRRAATPRQAAQAHDAGAHAEARWLASHGRRDEALAKAKQAVAAEPTERKRARSCSDGPRQGPHGAKRDAGSMTILTRLYRRPRSPARNPRDPTSCSSRRRRCSPRNAPTRAIHVVTALFAPRRSRCGPRSQAAARRRSSAFIRTCGSRRPRPRTSRRSCAQRRHRAGGTSRADFEALEALARVGHKTASVGHGAKAVRRADVPVDTHIPPPRRPLAAVSRR